MDRPGQSLLRILNPVNWAPRHEWRAVGKATAGVVSAVAAGAQPLMTWDQPAAAVAGGLLGGTALYLLCSAAQDMMPRYDRPRREPAAAGREALAPVPASRPSLEPAASYAGAASALAGLLPGSGLAVAQAEMR